jgi:hypothetical protein
MPYAQGFKYDVFISFSLGDNEPVGPKQERWVERFHKELTVALRMRLGAVAEIFYSERNAQTGGFDMAGFADSAGRSALMVAVVSRNYVRPASVAVQELQSFVKLRGTDRLFAVQILPYPDDDPGIDVLRSKIAKKFWYTTASGNTPAPLFPSSDDKANQYIDLVGDLAEALSASLRPLGAQKAAPAAAGLPLGTVLLAQVTDDLVNAREAVRRYLAQFGVRVVPEADVDYPTDASAFDAAFLADAGSAALVVQLLSEWPGRRPDRFVGRQCALAATAGKPLAQWRSPALLLDKVEDAEQRKLLDGATVLVDNLDNFNASVIASLRALAQPKPAPGAAARDPASVGDLIFINAHESDMDLARSWSELLQRNGRTPSLPVLNGPSATALREDLKDNMKDCDSLLLLYGRSSNLWVRSQLRLFTQVKARREAPLRSLLLCNAPPEPKDPVEMYLPELKEVSAADFPNFLRDD